MVQFFRPKWINISVLLLFFGAVVIYGFSISYVYSGDDIQYAIVIQSATSGEQFYHPAGGRPYISTSESTNLDQSASHIPINPRYLLEWPTSVLAVRLWQAFSYQGSVMHPIFAIRVIAGALGLVFFFTALRRLLDSGLASGIAAIGLGISVAFWTYSTHIDQSINMVMWLCLGFLILIQYQTGFTRQGMISLAIVSALASFYNFTALLSVLAFGIGLAILRPDQTRGARIRIFIEFMITYGVISALGLIIAVAIFVSPASLIDPTYWSSVLFGGKPEYGVNLLGDAVRAGLGLAKSQVAFPNPDAVVSLQRFWDGATSNDRIGLITYFGTVLALMAVPIAFMASNRKHLKATNYPRVIAFLVVWFILHAAFNYFWDPGFIKYWLMPLVVVWSFFAIALKQSAQSGFWRGIVVSSLVIVVLNFGLNIVFQFGPQSRPEANPWIEVAESLKESSPNDLFISSGAHPLDFLISYLTRRDIISIQLINYDRGNVPDAFLAPVLERVAAHRADQGNIYLYGIETLPEETRALLLNGLGLPQLREKWSFAELSIYQAVF